MADPGPPEGPWLSVRLLHFWRDGGGAELRARLEVFPRGASSPAWSTVIGVRTTGEDRFQEALRALRERTAEELSDPAVTALVSGPMAAAQGVPPAGVGGAGAPAVNSAAATIEVGRVVLRNGEEIVGTVLVAAESLWCLGTVAGERVVAVGQMGAASRWTVDLGAGAGHQWAVLQGLDGVVVTGRLEGGQYAVSTATGLQSLEPSRLAGALVGPIVVLEPGGLCSQLSP